LVDVFVIVVKSYHMLEPILSAKRSEVVTHRVRSNSNQLSALGTLCGNSPNNTAPPRTGCDQCDRPPKPFPFIFCSAPPQTPPPKRLKGKETVLSVGFAMAQRTNSVWFILAFLLS